MKSHRPPAASAALLAVALALALALPTLAHAHAGAGATHGFLAGAMHPVGGLDHLCAMLAVGLWAAQLGQRALWAVPLAFVSLMTLGSVLGAGGLTFPLVEQGILASVLLLGILVFAAARLPLAICVALVGLFALCHGIAHGSEMPESASGLRYGAGFVLATVLLHGCGIGLSLLMQRLARPDAVRYAGAMIAVGGAYLGLA